MWNRIVGILKDPTFTPTSATEVEELLASLLPPAAESAGIVTDVEALTDVLLYGLTADEAESFFKATLPWMRRKVIDAPVSLTFGGALPLLRQSSTNRVTLTDRDCSTLLCCAFFSLFPERHRLATATRGSTTHAGAYSAKLPNINFGYLFGLGGTSTKQKIRCLIEYFTMRREIEQDHNEAPTLIEILRVTAPPTNTAGPFRTSTAPITSRVSIIDAGAIEDCAGELEVDFANKLLGGGVIGRGCVQEEIRFVINPELFVGRLICEQLLPDETVYVSGARQYVAYTGYSDTFAYAGRYRGAQTVVDSRGVAVAGTRRMHNIAIVAMDATNYKQWNMQPVHQYLPAWIERDARKALVAFAGYPAAALPAISAGSIATGNWGCGAFGGDHELKFLLQLCAASVASRPLKYFTFGTPGLRERLANALARINEAGMRVCDLYTTLERYHDERFTMVAPIPPAPDPVEDALARHSTLEYEFVETIDGTLEPIAKMTDDDIGFAMTFDRPAAAAAVPRLLTVLEHVLREIEDCA